MARKRKKYKLAASPAPLTAQEKVSRYMRGNKSKNTKPELMLRKALWHEGLRGYRVHWPKAPGKPDVCYPSRKLAIFIHGCLWHQCPYCKPPQPKTNVDFWQRKFENNIKRDVKYKQLYREAGWQRIVIWECQLRPKLPSWISVIRELHNGIPDNCKLVA